MKQQELTLASERTVENIRSQVNSWDQEIRKTEFSKVCVKNTSLLVFQVDYLSNSKN